MLRTLRLPFAITCILTTMMLGSGCKKECPICHSYIAAVKKCVTTNPPSGKQLEGELKTCLGFCKKKMAAPVGERRAWISRTFMARQMCVVDYSNQGCGAFLKCLERVKKKRGH